MITALIIVIQLIIGFDFSVNIYSAVVYTQWYCILLPKSELHGRFIQRLWVSRLLSLINSTINSSLTFRANQNNQRKKIICIVSAFDTRDDHLPPISALVSGILFAASPSTAPSGCCPSPIYTLERIS